MATNTPVDIGSLITSRPGVQGGRPCLAGTRMPVHVIAARFLEGLNAEQIYDEYPHLDLARIHAALAYYFANRELIDGYLKADSELYDELAKKFLHGWTRETDPDLNP